IMTQGKFYDGEKWPTELEKEFHMRIYKIVGNPFITQFQKIVHIVFGYAKENYDLRIKPINDQLRMEGKIITHHDLFNDLKERDRDRSLSSIKGHLARDRSSDGSPPYCYQWWQPLSLKRPFRQYHLDQPLNAGISSRQNNVQKDLQKIPNFLSRIFADPKR